MNKLNLILIIKLNLPNEEKKKQNVSDIKALRKEIKNKKLEIKVANPNLNYSVKLQYWRRSRFI